MPSPPRRWLAALLSFMFPGLGHLYAGALRPAAAFTVTLLFTAPLMGYLLLLGPLGFLVALLWVLALVVFASLHAWRVSSRVSPASARPWFSRWFSVLPAWLATALVFDALNGLRKEHIAQAFRAPSSSMEPTVISGDYLVVDSRAAARRPAHGALLVHESVEEPGLQVLKRVAALALDTVAMRHGVLLLNGVPVQESYLGAADTTQLEPEQRARMRQWQTPHLVRADSAYDPDLDNSGPLAVPPSTYFALGDTRHASYDSRYYGFIPYSQIRGRAKYVYLSHSRGVGFRWTRIGTRLD